jgi:hypothetical protein
VDLELDVVEKRVILHGDFEVEAHGCGGDQQPALVGSLLFECPGQYDLDFLNHSYAAQTLLRNMSRSEWVSDASIQGRRSVVILAAISDTITSVLGGPRTLVQTLFYTAQQIG